ncbi:MAG: sulfotransferase family protein [Solirubrobacterales bacterium]
MSEGASAARPPIVVFGIGGSGTRAVAEILTAAGVYIGPRLNKASDAHVIHRFLQRRALSYLEASGWLEPHARDPAAPPPQPADPATAEDPTCALAGHREGIPSPNARWGWKHPRTAYVLPVVHELLPDAWMIQLVRDGRDMAYSQNQNQLAVYGDLLVGDMASEPEPVRSVSLWSRVNLAALHLSRRERPQRFLLVRYEDLCAEPAAQIERLFRHVEIDFGDDLVERAAKLVSPSPTAQRWREADPDELRVVERAGAQGLREFGYADG